MDATMENKMGLPPPYEQMPANPAPPPSYFGNEPPPPTAPPRTVVVTSAPATRPVTIKMGPGPTGTVCPMCNKSIVTRVDYVPNNRTHIASAALCVIAGCCCGCFVPYCMKSCKTVNHYCPQCSAFIGARMPSMAKRAKCPRDVKLSKGSPLPITTATPPRLVPKWYRKSRSPN